MAFAYTVTKARHTGGQMRVIWGTYTNGSGGGDTGGAITTGLRSFVDFTVMPSSAVGTAFPKFTLATDGTGVATLVLGDGNTGKWKATGFGGG